MTKRYRELVRDVLERGLQVACEAFTTNTAKGVQITLRMPSDPDRIPKVSRVSQTG